jgi:flagellar biosynthesis chaperone FliJ
MKKIYYILTFLLCVYVQTANAQMGVNSTGAAPATSAMLDVSSTTKGFLMPRMTTAQRTTLGATAINGMQVFDSDLGEVYLRRFGIWSPMNVPRNAFGISDNSASPIVAGYNSGTGIGVHGIGGTGSGVVGSSTSGFGVYGISSSDNGVYGYSSGAGTGVNGLGTSGYGGYFVSTTGTALGISGVGSTSPSSSTNNPLLRINLANDNNYGWVRFENSTGARSFAQRYDLFSPTAASNSYALYYGTDQLFTIRGDGKFGLNVNSPSDLLHLSPISATGDVYTRLSTTSGLAGLRLQNAAGDWSLYSNEFSKLFLGYSTDNFANTNQVLVFEPNGANYNVIPSTTNQVFLGTSGFRWREIWSQNNLNTSSDRRLKKNINEIKYGLDEIMKLQAVTYNWKDNDDRRLQLGFIAQDVEKIVPEIVTKSGISDEEFERLEKKGEKVTDTYGMQYTGLIPVLVKAVQEQQKVIEEKVNRISQLEDKLLKMNGLEARLNLIEALMNNQKSENPASVNDK